MKKERKKQNNALKNKLLTWLKQPENIFLIAILLAVAVVGLVEGSLTTIAIVYAFAFLFGLLWRVIFYLKNKFF